MDRTRRFFVFCALSLILCVCCATFVTVASPEDKAVLKEGEFIKWVDFNVTYGALSDCLKYDIKTYGTKPHASWIDLLACLAARGSGTFSGYKPSDLKKLTDALEAGTSIEDISAKLKSFPYYKEAYAAVLGGFVGEYEIEAENENGERIIKKTYGLKAFSPIARGYGYSDFDDFGGAGSVGLGDSADFGGGADFDPFPDYSRDTDEFPF